MKIDTRPRDIFVKNPILILLIEKLLHKSVLQQDVVVVTPPADNWKVPAINI